MLVNIGCFEGVMFHLRPEGQRESAVWRFGHSRQRGSRDPGPKADGSSICWRNKKEESRKVSRDQTRLDLLFVLFVWFSDKDFGLNANCSDKQWRIKQRRARNWFMISFWMMCKDGFKDGKSRSRDTNYGAIIEI